MSVGGTCLTPEQAKAICERIADGRSLRSICEDKDIPSRSVVYEALEGCKQFADRYARARKLRAEFRADEIIEIVDSEPDPAIARVKMDARKWEASKLDPTRYGERTKTEVTGADGGPLAMTFDATIRFVDPPKQGGGDAS